MSQIHCPSCARSTSAAHAIEETMLQWECPRCNKHFEVRIVFFERPLVVDKAAFTEEVRGQMERQGLNQAELARLMGVTGAYVSTLLSGKREISQDVAERVRRALVRRPTQLPSRSR